jgi:uncharacterized protein
VAEVISFLGAQYTIIDRLAPLLVFIGIAFAALGVAVVFRSRAAATRLLGLVPIAAGALIGMAAGFVSSRVHDLTVPVGYSSRAVTIATGTHWLAGEILEPASAAVARPAMIFLVGSDASGYRSNYSRLANEVLTPTFASLNATMLYFDKRGIGDSTGDWTTAGIEDRAADARAALAFLRARAGVDPNRLVVVGHSQGGWVVQLLAADLAEIAAGISLAGPTVSVEEQIVQDAREERLCAGESRDAASAAAESQMAELKRQAATAPRGRLAQFAAIASYRPDLALKSVRRPLLLVFGENDRVVPASENLARLSAIVGEPLPNLIETIVLPGSAHSLRVADRCHEGSQSALRYAPQLRPRITEFLRVALGS